MTNPILFSNNAQSTLAGSITNTATTANLAPGTGALFPNPGVGQYFVATFIDQTTGLLREVVHVTQVVGDAITMVRAQEGTTALNWSAGDIFANFMTAGTAAAFRQSAVLIDLTADVTGVLPLANLPASNTSGGIAAFRLNAGNPNGAVAGNASVNGASDICYDTTNKVLYVCTTTGNAAGAVWSASNTLGVVFTGGVSAGTAGAQTLATLTPDGFGLVTNNVVIFLPGFTSIGATTLNADATGVKNIKKMVSGVVTDIAAGDLVQNQPAAVVYNGSVYILLNPAAGTAAAKTASDNTKQTVASVNGPVTPGNLAIYSDAAGTVKDGGAPPLSGRQAVTGAFPAVGASSTIAHNLNAVPAIVSMFLKCKSANNGWSVGDLIGYGSCAIDSNTGLPQGLIHSPTAVNVTVYNGAPGGRNLEIPNKTTNAASDALPTDWDLYLILFA